MHLIRSSEQFASDPQEQAALYAAFVMGAIMGSTPTKAVFFNMLRNACDHGELTRLEHAMTIQDDTVRGFMTAALVGDVLARCAIEGCMAYNRERAKR